MQISLFLGVCGGFPDGWVQVYRARATRRIVFPTRGNRSGETLAESRCGLPNRDGRCGWQVAGAENTNSDVKTRGNRVGLRLSAGQLCELHVRDQDPAHGPIEVTQGRRGWEPCRPPSGR